MTLGISIVAPAGTPEGQTEPTNSAATESVPLPTDETTAPETTPRLMDEATATESTVPPTEVTTAVTETTPPATEQSTSTETGPQSTEEMVSATESVTLPTESVPAATEGIATETIPADLMPPVITQPAETNEILAVADETAPTEATEPTEPPDAGPQDDDLGVVSGQGITFKLFNYSTNINKSAGNTSWRPISSYFTFRNSWMEIGTDASLVNIPSPNMNTDHDQDGFTAMHATVERVLSGGLPVLDLTRNADGSSRTDPDISSSVRSLAYLFSSGDHAVTAYSPRNTILQRSGSHYWYNSADHAVDYDTDANLFRLRGYTERNSTTAGYGAAYGDFLPFTYTEGIVTGTTDDGTSYHVLTGDTDYWFGMTMTVNFFQTKGGKLSDQDMIFSFSGDDDVWVFVDDVLVLDLGGTHGTADGSINFATGEVRQYLSWNGANATETARTEGSATSFPTTIRACFDAAGRTPKGGWSADGQTFADFTEHTLKFFYLERGSAVANCMLDFRLPTLPDESLTVTKDLAADSDTQVRDFIADSLAYRFRVMKTDAQGAATDEFFIKSGMTYDLLQSGSKIGTGTVGEDGCFALKAGQSAQFAHMLQKGGGATEYVVEEIMPDTLTGQYAGVEYLVSGTGGDTVTEDLEAENFTAFRTGILSAGQTQTVTFRNRVDTSKLCTLAVTKRLAPGTVAEPDTVFRIQVKLGGDLLPAGTPYTVSGEERNVEAPGILELRAGETALLSQGILSGTAYEVSELHDGTIYRPAYTATVRPEADYTASGDGICSIFPLAGEVHVTVTNADYDFAVQLPIEKTVHAFRESDTFFFSVVQVEPVDDGWDVVRSLPMQRITVTDDSAAKTVATIGYDAGTEGTFYYRISELPGSGAYIDDDCFYIVEVAVAENEASVVGILRNGQEAADAVAFVNHAATSLTVSKTITGVTGNMKFPFAVSVFLNGEAFSMPQPDAAAPYTVSANVISFSLGHGDSVTIPRIPIGAVIRIEERQWEGFEVFHKISGADEDYIPGCSREVVVSNTAIYAEFRNHSGFRLPNTGGMGTDVYTAGGVALQAALWAVALYLHYGKRKEEDASS